MALRQPKSGNELIRFNMLKLYGYGMNTIISTIVNDYKIFEMWLPNKRDTQGNGKIKMSREKIFNSFISRSLCVICDADVCTEPWVNIKCQNKEINEMKFIEKSMILLNDSLDCVAFNAKVDSENGFIVV